MFSLRQFGWIALTVGCLAATDARAAAIPIIQDALDQGTWTATGGSNFATNDAGLTPSAGTTFWGSTYHLTATVGVSKTFTGTTVQAGIYRLMIDTAAPDPPSSYSPAGYSPVPLAGFSQFGLTGLSVPRVTVSAPTPPAATPQWTTWLLQYTVPDGGPDIGHTLGFAAQATATNYSVMLDNVRVSFEVPEPGSTAAAVALCGACILRRQRHLTIGRDEGVHECAA
jgi:hypothetical protein